jgi:hypothetical protein
MSLLRGRTAINFTLDQLVPWPVDAGAGSVLMMKLLMKVIMLREEIYQTQPDLMSVLAICFFFFYLRDPQDYSRLNGDR